MKFRCDILQELHRFYTVDMGLKEYLTRLGRLLTICHSFTMSNTLFQEFFGMQTTILDLKLSESMLRELVLIKVDMSEIVMSEDVSRQCLICSTPTSSVHFGIDACRACSSFFKRAQLSGHRYPCRKGDHKCDRMALCVVVAKCSACGMAYDGPMRKYYPKNTMEDSTPSPSDKEESLLDRIGREHSACVKRRRVQEVELVKLHNLSRVKHPTEEVYLASFSCAFATFNVTVAESWKLFLAVFPSMKDLSYTDQREFFRLCMPQFALVDCFCRTKRIWGGFVQYSMCSVLLCSDINSPEVWVGMEEGGPMREELLDAIRAYIHDQMALMLPSFDKADICEREMHACLALMLCESDPENAFADRFQSFFDTVRAQIMEALHRFYTEKMRISDYSTRLGNLLTICHTFREGNTLFQEFFRMQVTVFDLYISNSILKDLLL
ncbi:hypothetical protein PRIPAC_80485 [Pristionchus pacificus]|uniref:Nuclear receptor n=1 Tax=Pristionchus pacificus TaxID=54126 RepID=A0A2A6CNP1_PRIPA|nr:hypothetical protein PRIPAC_80485 [Pristionchus pacificus]|eukprot:PDM79749.1 nuclear receptor [Pristionchus pacificus]